MMQSGVGDVHEGEDLLLIPLEVGGEGEGYGIERRKVGRHPRWSRHETLVLIEAKMVEEAKWSKSRLDKDRMRGIDAAKYANGDPKWLSISLFCERHGVMRSSAQCRKRWCNLSADYKRIKDWQCVRGQTIQSFWLISNDIRKENRLPGCFDPEVFESLDKCLGKEIYNASETIFDSGKPSRDEVLFPDMKHPLQEEVPDIKHPLREEEIQVSLDKEPMESATPTESPTPTTGTCQEKLHFNDEHFPMGACEEMPHVQSAAHRKRKRLPVEENVCFPQQLFSMLESNSRVLTAHMESQNLNSQLDRNQRKENADSLVGVLGKLADALGKIAERL